MAPPGRIRPVRRPLIAKAHDDFEPCWEILRDALTNIHTQDAGRLSFENLYRASYKIVVNKKGDVLYERVKSFEEAWFRDHIMPRISKLITTNLVNVALVQAEDTSLHERREMGQKFLRGIRDAWVEHNMSMNMIADIMMYLDRAYISDAGLPTVFATTIGLFRDHVLRNTLGNVQQVGQEFVVFDILNAVILDLINMEREGEIIDCNLLRNITSMLEDLYETNDEIPDQKLYLTVFEPKYIDASAVFYRKECGKLLRESDASTWLRHTKRRLEEEAIRCTTSLSILTKAKIEKVIEKEMVLAQLDGFLSMEASGLKSMIDNDRVEDLFILYRLILRVDPSMEPIKATLQNRVTDLGSEIEKTLKSTDFSVPAVGVADADDAVDGAEKGKAQPLNAAAQQTAAAIKWVDEVLKLKDKFDRLWQECFQEDLILQSAISKSFTDFINMFNRSSEYVSLFIDDTLKRGARSMSEVVVDGILDKAIVLLPYLSDRDMFERYYQKHLARRLLHNKSEIDIEKDMVSRMKTEMGNHFTAKFEGMFKDMQLSKDLGEGYREHIRQLGDVDTKKVDLSIHVLTSNYWPPEVMGRGSSQDEGSKGGCNYPPVIKRLQESFLKYYLKDRSGRVLTWVGSAGTADIKCVFPKVPGKESGPLSKERRYELNVSTYGMVVLMLFNDLAEGESLSLEEIQAKTNIPISDLTRTLASLSIAPRTRVLVKEPATKTVKSTDRFSFNAQFASKAIKIKAPTIASLSKVEGEEERKVTEQKNDQTRSHIIDAAIVRIMKSRKELRHTQLTTDVITQLSSRFKPEVSLIKRRIEDLLAREYLERVEGEQSLYRYLA
ncbi:hypothetical protein QBC47DRAFT_359140 [Echria macrotheca]|uniref:Cullin family profile domain-containing protein n=1 Tax=Echria macrotheca TaxID=438768 RepID=A0AAJ0F7G7_9PEZI|nr:hypothetical protein QBC47DRAFT_359140 [Echria macrotheca]